MVRSDWTTKIKSIEAAATIYSVYVRERERLSGIQTSTQTLMADEEEVMRNEMTLSQLRAGHRGTITRVIGQLDDTLERKEAPKLRLLRRTLVNKSALLVRYDEDILNLVTDEEKVEEDIGRADIIQEISLSVIRIDEALEALSLVPTVISEIILN